MQRKTRRDTIWIVDDEEEVSEIIAWDLSNRFETRTFNHPSKLIDELRRGKSEPSLVISDIAMPGMNGIDLSQTLLKEMAVTFPIILISGFAEKDHALRAMELGIARIVEKPFSRSQILTAIDDVIKIAHLQKLSSQLVQAYRQSMQSLEKLVLQYKRQCEEAEARLLDSVIDEKSRIVVSDYLAAMPDQEFLKTLCKTAHDKITAIESELAIVNQPFASKKAA